MLCFVALKVTVSCSPTYFTQCGICKCTRTHFFSRNYTDPDLAMSSLKQNIPETLQSSEMQLLSSILGHT